MTAQEGLKKAALQYFDSPAFRKFLLNSRESFTIKVILVKALAFKNFLKKSCQS